MRSGDPETFDNILEEILQERSDVTNYIWSYDLAYARLSKPAVLVCFIQKGRWQMGIFGESKKDRRKRHVYKDYMRQVKYHAGRGLSEHEANQQALQDVNRHGAGTSGSEIDSIKSEAQKKGWGNRSMREHDESPDWPPNQ